MSFSMTRTAVESFTLTQAKYLTSKVATDMRRCQQLYGKPSDPGINDYGTELALMLRDEYVASYEFGWVRVADDERVLTWRYSVTSAGTLSSDDRPGRIVAGVNVTGCSFRTYMSYTAAWWSLIEERRIAYRESMPIDRNPAREYGSSLGVWHTDLTYSSTGVAMVRHNFKLYGT
jgi:hypothetical protein